MPTYDYRILATGAVHEVKHSITVKAVTWGELCALGNLDPGDTDPASPVERLLSAAGVVRRNTLRNPEPPCGGGGCAGGACGFAA